MKVIKTKHSYNDDNKKHLVILMSVTDAKTKNKST